MAETPQERALKEARERFGNFPTHTSDMTDMVDFHAQQIHAKLKEAGLGPAALGFASDAAGEAEIEKRRKDCALRSARKMFGAYLTDLYPRELSSVEFRRGQIAKMVAHAGRGLEALDENGNSTVADIEARLDAAGKAMLRLTARKLFRELTEGDTASKADLLDHYKKTLTDTVVAAGFGWADIDPQAGGEAAVKDKLEAGLRRCNLLAARNALAKFRVTPTDWPEHMIEYHVNKINTFLKCAEADAAALDPAGKATTAEMERAIEGAAERARCVSLLKHFEDEKEAPASLQELQAKMGRMKRQFDKAKEYFDAADPALADVSKRFDAAARKARDHACEVQGLVPLMKPISFGNKGQG